MTYEKGTVANKMKFMQKLRFQSRDLILFGVGILVVFLLVVYMFTAGLTLIHSDSASAVMYAQECIRTGSLFPENWIGATGILTLPYPIWLFLHITSDYLLAHALAQLLWLALLIGSLVVLSRYFFQDKSWLISIPMLCTGISTDVGYDMMFIQCAYTMLVFMTLYTLGAFGKAVEDFEAWKINRRWLCITAVLIMVSCSMGILFVQALLLPLLGAIVLLYLTQMKHEERILNLPHITIAVKLCIIVFVAGCIGYGASILWSDLQNVAGNGNATTLAISIPQIMDNIAMMIQALFYYIDFSIGSSLFSVEGILTVIKFFVFVTITFIFPVFSYLNYKRESTRTQLFLIFVGLHVIEVIIVISFTNMPDYIGVSRYMLTSILLLNLVSAHYIYTHYIQHKNLLSYFYRVAIAGFSLILMLPLIPQCLAYQPKLEQMRQLTYFLEEQDLHYGYSTFWNSGKNTVLSNGAVQISGISVSEGRVSPFYWLTSTDWYQPDYYEGTTFLLLSSAELEQYAPYGLEATQLGQPDTILHYNDFSILVYDYNIAENNFTGMLTGEQNYVPSSMVVSDDSMIQEDGSIIIQSGQIMYGPYVDLQAGDYELTVVSELTHSQELNVTAAAGAEQLLITEIQSGTTVIPFTLDSDKQMVEFVVHNTENDAQKILSITLKKCSDIS